MNSKGLIDSKRDVKDGRAYFGTDAGQDQYLINDYILSMEEQGLGKRHFVIEFDPEKNIYLLKSLGDGTGTFIKVMDKWVISSNLILSFSTLHLAIIVNNELTKSELDSRNDPSLKDIPKDIPTDPKRYFILYNVY